MSTVENPSATTAKIYACKICGKVGIGGRPTPVDFGGCATHSQNHIFAEFEVFVKTPAVPAKPAQAASDSARPGSNIAAHKSSPT